MTKISVQEHAEGEIPATSAHLHVVLTGERFFSDSAIWREAAEVRQLLEATCAHGIADTDWSLESMSLDVSTGLFSRSSSVTFNLRLHLRDLEQLRHVLDVLAGAKKCRMTHVEWDYSGATEERTALLRQAVLRAKHKAETMAAALGLSVQSIDEVVDRAPTEIGLRVSHAAGGYDQAVIPRARQSSASAELAKLELAPTQRLTVHASMTITAA